MGRTKISKPIHLSRTPSLPQARDSTTQRQSHRSPLDLLKRTLSSKRHEPQAFTLESTSTPPTPKPVLYTHPNGALQLSGLNRTQRHIGDHQEEESFKGITASGKEIRVPHHQASDHRKPVPILAGMGESKDAFRVSEDVLSACTVPQPA